MDTRRVRGSNEKNGGGELSVKAAAEDHGIPRSTLQDKLEFNGTDPR